MDIPTKETIKDRVDTAYADENEAYTGDAAVLTDKPAEEPSLTEQATAKASEAFDSFKTFARERPLTTITGGLVAGILIASMFKAPRRAAAAGGAKAAGLAAIGSEIALAFAAQLADAAGNAGREGLRKAGDLGDSIGDTARSLRREAGYRTGNSLDAARVARRETRKAISRKLSGK